MKNVEDIYPLSPMQEGILFHTRHDPAFAMYFEIITATLHGDVDVDAFARAWQAVVDRHPVLRSAFVWEGLDEPLQVTRRRAKLPVTRHDWRGLNADEQASKLAQLFTDERTRGFDLSKAPLMRVTLIHTGDDSYRFVWSYYHGLIDGWSSSLIFNDVFLLYEALSRGVEIELPPTPSFRNYIEWLRGQDLDRAEEYWRRTLKGFSAATPIEFLTRPEREAEIDDTRSYREIEISLPAEITARLVRFTRQQQLTLNTVCQGAWAILLSRYSGQDDVLFGVAVSGRPPMLENVETMIGMLINTLPARFDVAPGEELIPWLKRVQTQLTEMREYEYSPLVQVQGWSDAPRTAPLFESIVAFENHLVDASLLKRNQRAEVRDVVHHTTATGYPLNILFDPGEQLAARLLYDFVRIEDDAATRILRHLETLLTAIAANPHRRLAEFPILAEAERRELLVEWNETAAEFPQSKCLHHLFEEQAARTPDAIAVIFEDQRLTYAELNERANQLAHYLRAEGVGPETLVAVMVERSLELVVSLLGILKAGGAYVPIDPDYPRERVELMLKNSGAGLVLTDAELRDRWPEIAKYTTDKLAEVTTAENLAYVMYTSGSTGTPKGAMVPHRGLISCLNWMQTKFPLDHESVFLMKTPLTFDPSVWEIFWPLSAGARIVVAPSGEHANTSYLVTTISRHQITHAYFVPAMLKLFLDEPRLEETARSLRLVISGGEKLPLETLRKFRERIAADLLHSYSPTEASISGTKWRVPREQQTDTVYMGRPQSNMQMYVLDKRMEPVPVGIKGELYIGGEGVGRGYLGRPDLTAASFLPDPFSTQPGQRLYRSGDVVRYSADGELEYLGRADEQVKIRGLRIEPGEIENSMKEHPAVRDCVVAARETAPDDKQLVAYIVPERLENLPLVPRLNGSEAGALFDGTQLSRLPNGMVVAGHGSLQASGVYREIFEDKIYLQHGIRLDDGACVFDVGANIGLFTLFVQQHARASRIYAFEPLPPNFAALQANARLYGLNVKLFECGLSRKQETATFTFYPHAAAMSGRGLRVAEDRVTTRANIESWLRNIEHGGAGTAVAPQYDLDSFVDHYLTSESYTCQLRTMSEIIREEGIERIDLLKLDVEKSEVDVLAGIEDEDWKKIRQLVVEVHSDELLAQITTLLRSRGFTFAVDKSTPVENGDAVDRGYMLYAWDPAQREETSNGHGRGKQIDAELSPDSLRNFLLERLPTQMVPSAFVLLEALPLMPNGKVDRRALPSPDNTAVASEDQHVSPRTPVEEIVAGICAAVLRLDSVSVKSDFFDLGGHSLLAAQVISRVRETFKVELSLRNLFQKPTVAGLAENIEKSLSAGEQISAGRIERASREADLPLSFSQQRLWFLDRMEGSTPYYNVIARMRLQGELNLEALQQAAAEIVRRHEILRTTFVDVGGRPAQIINPTMPLTLSIEDVPGETIEQRAETARRLAREEAERPFDLSRGPLLRVRLLRLADAENIALLTMHHIVSDGWSTSVLVNELTALYSAFSEGKPSPLEELPLQYADFAVWQREWLQGETLDVQLGYWREQLRGAPALLELPTDKPRPAVQTFNGATEPWQLGVETSSKLRQLARDEGATLYMTLLAAFTVLLSRHSGQTDVVIGSDIANRTRKETENLIGFFVNMVLLRSDLSGNPTFAELLSRVRETALGAYAHQDLPFEKLVDELQPERSLSHSPLFNVVFVLQNTPEGTLDLPGLKLSSEQFDNSFARFDLEFLLWEREGTLSGFLIYNTDLFEAPTTRRMLNHFEILLDGIVADPDQRVTSLPLLTRDERHTLLVDWTNTATEYPRNDSIHRQFELQAAQTPQATAVVFGAQTLTYGELNRRANQLAHHLKSLGVGPEVPVGLCVERSLELLVGTLGILKAGGYYLPLDPEYPIERLAFMLEDAGVPVLLTQESLLEFLPMHWAQVVSLDSDWELIAGESDENLTNETLAENLAYVMYTSGSTGAPKGVAVTHRGVLRLVKETDFAEFGADEVFLQLAPITFDASTLEIWGSLLNGGRLVVMAPHAPALEELGTTLRQHNVTTLWLSAGLFHLMVDERPDDLSGLRQLLAGGDVLSVTHVQKALNRLDQGRVINGYGPTENTTFTCCYPMTKADEIGATVPIGRPIANTQVYLLSEDLEPVPIGVAGELYTGGDGLARGYHNRPELTAQLFVPHPFGAPGERLYRTGDLARYLPDGRIEFLGRRDHQVKVRGFRIELEEIELALAGHPAMRQCVVLAREDGGPEKQLVAYVLLEQDHSLSSEEMRSYLRERLPEYMVPAQVVVLDAFPLTANGKVDRQALPAPGDARDVTQQEFIAPQTAAEKALAEIWQQVLGVDRVSVNDNFFDLGGDSIRSIQVHAQAQKRGYEFSVRQIFQHQTIAELAREAKSTGDLDSRFCTEPFSLISVDDRRRLSDQIEDAYPLSLLQRGMLYHTNLNPRLAIYHDFFSFRVQGSLDTSAFQEALQQLAAQHPILRTSFDLHSYSEPLQLVHRQVVIPLALIDMQHLSEVEQPQALTEWTGAEKKRGFDWSSAPILRFAIFTRGAADFEVKLSFHHAIFDGWSLSSMLTELFSRYTSLVEGRQPQIAPLAVTFRDFIALERQSLESEEVRQYWSKKLTELPVTALPPREGSPPKDASRQVLQVRFGSELVEGLKSLARLAGVPLKSVFMAAHCKVLGLITGQDAVTTGVVSNGRPEETDGDRVLGLFLNTIPFSLELHDSTWLELAQEAAELEREVAPFRRYPMAELQRVHGSQPLFEVSFNFTHFHVFDNVHDTSDLKIVGYDVFGWTNFPLSIAFDISQSELLVLVEHDLTRLSASQAQAIQNYLARALHSMAADPFSGSDISWALGDEERHRLLVEWNATNADYPRDVCLHQLIDTQAVQTPDAVALISGSGRVSYRELNERANQMAHYLKTLGVGPESLVSVMLDRSVEMVVTLLGILKAGAAYVPLDPAYPRERLSFMLEDANATVLISQRSLIDRLPEIKQALVLVDADRETIQAHSPENPAGDVSAGNLVYVIYTSGTTGQPKGVMLAHREVVNCVLWMQETYGLTPNDRMLCKTTLNFDPSIWEIFWPLLTGGQVVLSAPGDEQDTAALLQTIIDKQLTIAYMVPSLLTLFLTEREVERAASLRQMICGGESLPDEVVNQFYQRLPQATLHHSYGPTETAIASSETICRRNSPHRVTPIGRPLANTQLYVLDKQMQPLPIGLIGELYIGGIGLGRGYLNQPGLTAERFVPDPFGTEPGARLYRTGDLVRYLADGNLEFHGRRDKQVKLRGVRIELAEIEAAVKSLDGVHAAAVVMRPAQTGEDHLVAYVVPEEGTELVTASLRQKLAQLLPRAMVPTAWAPLPELPLLPNGKIDRDALPAPESLFESTDGYVAPSNVTEELIAGIWAEVLKLERVSVHDDFFAVGGHSLLATQVIARIFDVFHVDLGLRSLFETPTVTGLAHSVNAAMREGTLMGPLRIESGTRPETLPLSFAQQRLWFLEQLERAGAAYHIPVIFRIRGHVDVTALKHTLNEIVRRHESLRTTFTMVDGEPAQVIAPPQDVSLPIIDLSSLPPEQREFESESLSSQQAQLPFNLETGPLLRARLVRLGEDEHVLQMNLHHLIADGWSIGVLARETAAVYEAFLEGQSSPLPALPVQYADFAVWQREWFNGDLLKSQLAYWHEQLGGAPRALELPTDHNRPPAQSFRGAQVPITLPAALTQQLKRVSQDGNTTLFMTLLATFSVLLSRYANQNDVIIGTPIANRQQRELEEIIGFFANTLALRVNVQSELTFRELLRHVRDVTLGAYANQDVPFEKLVEELHPERELNRNPFFQVMFVLQNMPHGELTVPGLTIERQDFTAGATRFDLEFFLREEHGGLQGMVIYSTDLFERYTIEDLLARFERLLEAVVADPEQRVGELPLLTAAEEHKQLVQWNDTRAEFQSGKCVHELFEEQVARTPDAVAIEFGGKQLSYADLNHSADVFARRLRNVGVGPNTVTGICTKRSMAMLVSVLAVLKAGGAYLPLDAGHPPARLAYMLEDSGARVLITEPELLDRFSSLPPHVLYAGEEQSSTDANEEPSPAPVRPHDLAYVIYTSGSTGTPKGVAMPHRSLVNLLHWQMARSSRIATLRTLQFASLSFDVSFQEIFSTWCAGGTLVLIDEDTHRDMTRLWSTLAEQRIERLFLPFVALQYLAEIGTRADAATPSSLREIITAGEQLKITPPVRELFAKLTDCTLDNQYGPTEAHVVSALRLSNEPGAWPDLPPIGQPISNSQLYVLDAQMRPGPAGMNGELFISGDCLARGYLNAPDVTAEEFLPNPFAATGGARMYRTGDMARFTKDGHIQFLDRRDSQLKIRGYRIDVSEVETVLAAHPGIKEVLVEARTRASGEPCLVAYFVGRSEAINDSDLRRYLRERLPEHTIRVLFVPLAEFPLTPSGKIDRRALPALAQLTDDEVHVRTQAQTPTAELLAGIWAEVLGLNRVRLHDNFFDIGGHSLLATRVVARVREAFKLEMSLRRLFEMPTVFELATHIDEQLRSQGERRVQPAIQRQSQGSAKPLSFAQQRLWFWEQLEPGTPTYNLTSAFRLSGDLDLAVLERSIAEIVRRHEVLRTFFTAADGSPVQVIAPHARTRIKIEDLSSLPEEQREIEARRRAGEQALRPFDLSRLPLLRVVLLRLSEREHIAVVSMHHIISDGWSMGVLIDEIAALYDAYRTGRSSPLPELPVQYSDFAHWQRELLREENHVLKDQLDYWKSQLRDAPDLELRTDRPRPPVYNPRGAVMPVSFSSELLHDLKTLSRREGVTLFMTLLAAFKTLLHGQSGQQDVVVGTDIANRTHVETEGLIGFFVNMLVLRTNLAGDPTFSELLRRVREVTLGAYSHQDVPFAQLVQELHVKRDLSRNPLFQVVCVLQNAPLKNLELTGLTLSAFDFEVTTAPFDMVLALNETENGLVGAVIYNTVLFEEHRVRRLFEQYENLLRSVAANPQQPLSLLVSHKEAHKSVAG